MAPNKPIKLKIVKVLESCKTLQALWKDGVVAPGKMELYIDLKLPDEEEDDPKAKKKPSAKSKGPIDRKKVEMAAESRLAAIQKKIEESLEDAMAVVKQGYEATPQDYKRAKDALDKCNKFMEELLEDAPSEVRDAVYRRTGLPADDMSTLNDLTFKKTNLVRGRFKGDSAEALDDAPDYSDELKALWASKNAEKMGESNQDKKLKKEEIDCVLFHSKDLTMVLLGFSDKVKESDWKKYYGEEPEIVSGSFIPQIDQYTIKLDSKLGTKKNLLKDALSDQGGKMIKFA
ncbi:MAG: hypothetical protein U0939_05450 [Pirellulales bacterium]